MSEQPLFEVAQGTFPLRLPHASPRSSLQAWDGADHYLLREVVGPLQTSLSLNEAVSLWVFEDHYGALSVPLLMSEPRLRLTIISDPVASQEWVHENLKRCLRYAGRAEELSVIEERYRVTSLPEAERAHLFNELGAPNAVMIKVGPQLSMTRGALRLLARQPRVEWVIGGGMCKHVHTSTIKAFEAHLGESPTSLAWKKARLITPTLSAERPSAPPAKPCSYRLESSLIAELGDHASALLDHLRVLNGEGVFSEGQLDQGARAFIPYLSRALDDALLRRIRAGRPVSAHQPLEVADLGCGDGVLSWVIIACASARGASIRVTCLDLSSVAIHSAQRTWEAWCHSTGAGQLTAHASVRFLGGDALEPWRRGHAHGDRDDQGQLDLILNNPPFHQRGATVSTISERMFKEASQALTTHGALWVVGNRHLGYHQHLKRSFQQVSVDSDHPKFVILCATQPCQGAACRDSSAPLNPNKGPRRRGRKPATQLKQGRLRERRR